MRYETSGANSPAPKGLEGDSGRGECGYNALMPIIRYPIREGESLLEAEHRAIALCAGQPKVLGEVYGFVVVCPDCGQSIREHDRTADCDFQRRAKTADRVEQRAKTLDQSLRERAAFARASKRP